jgi:hypothetical protein
MAGVKAKVGKNPRNYAPWAGYFTDSKSEPEVFATLPGWRQRESLFVRDKVRAGEPILLEDLLRFQHGTKLTSTPVSLPAMLTLDSLRNRPAGAFSPDILLHLKEAFEYDWVVAQLTSLGAGRDLVRSKPLHGLLAYIWMLALLHKKVIAALPLHAFWELEDGIHQITGQRTSVLADKAAPLLEWLDGQTVRLVNSTA